MLLLLKVIKMSNKTYKSDSAKDSKSKITTRITILIILGVIIYAVIMIVNQQITLNNLKQKQQELLEQKEQLEADKNYYENELDYIDSDDYIIKEAKERLGWLFNDETKYVFDENKEQNP